MAEQMHCEFQPLAVKQMGRTDMDEGVIEFSDMIRQNLRLQLPGERGPSRWNSVRVAVRGHWARAIDQNA